jgi:hypothetical protein
MRELRWPLLIFALCLPIILLASGVRLPWLSDAPAVANPLPVPAGRQEIAWIHTTTNANTWERFVSGVVRLQMTMPGLQVDDARAFLDSTTAAPELVIRKDGHDGTLHIRWYKLQNEVTSDDWVQALAVRAPAPLAVIGGGSTDRAVDLAKAMAARKEWKGDRPPLLITTATADFTNSDYIEPSAAIRLVDLYDDRTFRFCFSNRQMAEAVVDFALQHPDLKPRDPDRVPVITVSWKDDRYSVDLRDQFTDALTRRFPTPGVLAFIDRSTLPFSVGGYLSPNQREAEVAGFIAARLRELPDQRVLLVLPGITQPSRRLLRAVLDAYPAAAEKLVVLTGDGIPINAVLRDGEFAWPVAAVPVTMALFAHNSPTAWDAVTDRPPPGYMFKPPNGTEEAMHFGELGRRVLEACFPPNGPLLTSGNELIDRLRSPRPAFFDANGERRGGTGEQVAVIRPRPEPTLTVWRRGPDGGWERLPNTPLDLRKRTGVEAP